jgi:transcriptional antiterminator RfaH
MLRLADNPPMTFPPDADLASVGGMWRAAYTKPRQEKSLAWDLLRLGVPYFLPLVQRQTVSGGRRRQGLYPLFPSYLFIGGDEGARLDALKTDRIVHLLEPKPAEQEQFRRQLGAICVALHTSPETVALHPRLVQGSRAVVRSGAMKGVEGVVISDRHRSKLLIEVSLLGVGATVEIHPDLLDPY